MAEFDDNTSCDSWQYKGLWEQICDSLKPQEIEEVRAAIGHRLIENNEELLKEIASVTEILNDFREQNSSLALERQKQRQRKRELLSSGSERRLLEQQIKMLLTERETTPHTLQAVNGSKVMSYLASTDPAFSNDDFGFGMPPSRNTHHSLPNSARPVSALSSARRSQSARSLPLSSDSLKNEVIGNSKCLNANDIGQVVACLRQGFKKEEIALKEEIDTLMGMFDEEDTRVNEDNQEIPTTSELRQFSTQLQEESKLMPVTRILNESTIKGCDFNSEGGSSKKALPSLAGSSRGNKLPIVPTLHLNPPPLTGKSSKLSAKFKSQVADAALTARDDFHLTDDSDYFM